MIYFQYDRSHQWYRNILRTLYKYFKFNWCIITRFNCLYYQNHILTISCSLKRIMEIKFVCNIIQVWLEPTTPVLQAYVCVHLTNVLIVNGSLKGPFIAVFEVLYLPALPIIVLCYWFLFVYVFHIIAFDL